VNFPLLARPSLPDFDFSKMKMLLGPAFTIAMLGGIDPCFLQ
jgi:hypothetical protein